MVHLHLKFVVSISSNRIISTYHHILNNFLEHSWVLYHHFSVVADMHPLSRFPSVIY